MSDNSARIKEIRAEMTKLLEEIRNSQNEVKVFASNKAQLETQKFECDMVKKEVEMLNSDNNIYKLTGTVLMKQNIDDVKQNITKRIDYIVSELSRIASKIQTLEENDQKSRATLMKLETEFRALNPSQQIAQQ